jgi:hypothetical protein
VPCFADRLETHAPCVSAPKGHKPRRRFLPRVPNVDTPSMLRHSTVTVSKVTFTRTEEAVCSIVWQLPGRRVDDARARGYAERYLSGLLPLVTRLLGLGRMALS